VQERAALLAAMEVDTRRALEVGGSPNLVVHAFARTAGEHGIGWDLVGPFFDSMRADLDVAAHDPRSFDTYVYGSAEVVGLMCLRVFVGGDQARYEALTPGARALGAAFQKLNFLRDLADDHDARGRDYFPGVDPRRLTDAQRDLLLDDIDADLASARAVIPDLPPSSRRAVQAAHDLFAALSVRLRRTPAAEIATRRVRVPDPVKAVLLARCLVGRR
jgi:15-cis-phytoene synthase